MSVWRNAATAALALSVVAAGSAAAQGKNQDKQKAAEDACKIDFSSSDAVRSGYNTITVLQLGASKPDDAKKKLTSVIADLTKKPPSGKDALGTDFVLGASYVLLYENMGEPAAVKPGDVGVSTNPAASMDLLAAADSDFTAVEKAMPDCTDRTTYYRQRPWVKMINAVGPLINQDKVDSAKELLSRAELIYRGSPFGYYFQGHIAQKQQNWDAATTAYSKAVALATPELVQKDSNVANVKEFSEFSAAFSQLQAASKLQGEAQQAGMKKAVDLYRAYLKDYPNGPNAHPAQAGLTAALKASGDTASLASMWSDMVANPTKYNDAQLFDAGTQAFSANQIPMAVKLMEAGNAQNPYLRGGLFNLANAYWKAAAFDKMLPITKRLVEIDPNSPDDYQLVAIAYQGLEKKVSDPKVVKAYGDSVSKYVTTSEKLPVTVNFTAFSHDTTHYSLEGTVENVTAAAKTVTLPIQFIDDKGNVVASKSTEPLALGPKGSPTASKKFSISVDGAAIKAFKYPLVK